MKTSQPYIRSGMRWLNSNFLTAATPPPTAARLQGAAGGRRDGASKKIGVTCKTLKPRILFGEVSYVYHCVDVAYILLAASTMASTQQLVSGFACMIASELDFDSCEVTSHGQ